jgi:hypothetical protein
MNAIISCTRTSGAKMSGAKMSDAKMSDAKTSGTKMSGSKTCAITSQPYYDTYNKCYKNILVINAFPQGPLASLVKKIQTPKLSPFKQSSPCCPIENCVYAIHKIDNLCELMDPDDIPNLFSYLIEYGYKIDTSLTKMMNTSDIKTTNKLLCYISLIN